VAAHDEPVQGCGHQQLVLLDHSDAGAVSQVIHDD